MIDLTLFWQILTRIILIFAVVLLTLLFQNKRPTSFQKNFIYSVDRLLLPVIFLIISCIAFYIIPCCIIMIIKNNCFIISSNIVISNTSNLIYSVFILSCGLLLVLADEHSLIKFGIVGVPAWRGMLWGLTYLLICELIICFYKFYLGEHIISSSCNDLTTIEMGYRTLLGPISEEVFFRGYFYSRLRKTMGVIPAILCSGICFAIVHPRWQGMFWVMLNGILFALLLEHSRSLIAPIVAHSSLNMMGVFIHYKNEYIIQQLPWAVLMGILLITIFLLAYCRKKIRFTTEVIL